jgi:hypothetical protein
MRAEESQHSTFLNRLHEMKMLLELVAGVLPP